MVAILHVESNIVMLRLLVVAVSCLLSLIGFLSDVENKLWICFISINNVNRESYRLAHEANSHLFRSYLRGHFAKDKFRPQCASSAI